MTDTSAPNIVATQALFEQAQTVQIPAGTTLFRQGDPCENYLLVTQGSVKVFARSESGREIVLYRINAGNSCVLTTSCLLGSDSYPAEGISETEVQALALPIQQFEAALSASPEFRHFVFTSFAERLSRLITLVEQISFDKIDRRLARVLLDRQAPDHRLQLTHQDLSTELGTAREVVSRQLKEFEQRGLITLSRGAIRIVDQDGMEKICAPV